MVEAKDFVHLPLPLKEDGRAFYRRPSIPQQSQTLLNNQNRTSHGNKLKNSAMSLSRFWQDRRNERTHQNLPIIEGGIPFLLQIDPSTDVDFLRNLGFEVVCDLDEGFIVVSSEETDLSTFIRKVEDFIQVKNKKSGSPARVYALCSEDDRLRRILSNKLYDSWAILDINTAYVVDIAIECYGLASVPSLPDKYDNESDDDYEVRLIQAKNEFYSKIDTLVMERQQHFENIVNFYKGDFLTPYIEDTDSFTVRISINGAGLRDIILNYAYIFEVSEIADVKMESAIENIQSINDDLTILPPEGDSPIVCVIDSGIQENHKYLRDAIVQADSVCIIPNQTTTIDDVGAGGHGTRVAGSVLYPQGIPVSGSYQLPCFIRNIKAIDYNNTVPMELNPVQIISYAVKKFAVEASIKSKIFNHSIGESRPFYEFKHMSAWASKIDDASHENDVLFIQAAGNMTVAVINAHIQAGYNYPSYLGRELSRLSNPAQSLQALTVGSISDSDFEDADRIAMGKTGELSSFSRIGPGIWDSVKPDVVEYGGTHVINKGDGTLTTPVEVCPELIRRSPEGPAHSKDNIGTSFAAPKVAYIAAEIQKALPNAPALLYRALIVQSARWPDHNSNFTPEQKQMLLRQMGYGLPDVKKATVNDDYRVTLVTTEATEISTGEAHIYTIHFPDELRNIGEDYNILVEITLSYSAKPRRTRRRIKGYLSTWLDWICSNKGETSETFRQRIFETETRIQDDGNFNWTIHERNDWGTIKDFNRKNQTLQKDWCIVKSSQLSEGFCVAIRGHKGWSNLFKAKYALAVSFEAIDQNIEIYEYIRVSNQVEVEVENEEVRVEVEDLLKSEG